MEPPLIDFRVQPLQPDNNTGFPVRDAFGKTQVSVGGAERVKIFEMQIARRETLDIGVKTRAGVRGTVSCT
jgi:hypothetical protein